MGDIRLIPLREQAFRFSYECLGLFHFHHAGLRKTPLVHLSLELRQTNLGADNKKYIHLKTIGFAVKSY